MTTTLKPGDTVRDEFGTRVDPKIEMKLLALDEVSNVAWTRMPNETHLTIQTRYLVLVPDTVQVTLLRKDADWIAHRNLGAERFDRLAEACQVALAE